MSHQASIYSDAPPIDAGEQVARLRQLLGRVEATAGSACDASHAQVLDEAASTSIAYERSLPVSRKRFDALAEETATWAVVALEALDRIGCGDSPRAAATQVARELEAALRALARTLQLR